MIALDVGGYWWLPGREHAKIPGFLAFDATNGITLRLIGALVSWEEVAPSNEPNGAVVTELSEHTLTTAGIYDRILGEAEGKCYTLEDCFESYRSINLFGGSTGQTVHANRLFANVQFEPGEAAGGDGLVVQPDWLTNWISRSGVASEPILSKDPQDPQFRLTGRLVPEESVNLSDGSELILQHHMHVDGDVAGPGISEASKVSRNGWPRLRDIAKR